MTNHRKTRLLISIIILICSPSFADFDDISVEDRLAIQEVLANYAHTWDSKDVEGYVALFTPEANYSVHVAGNKVSEFVSREQRHQYATALTASLRSQGIQTRHFIANTVLTRLSDDTVGSKSYFHVMQRVEGVEALIPANLGTYSTTFISTDAGWKIAEHGVFLD